MISKRNNTLIHIGLTELFFLLNMIPTITLFLWLTKTYSVIPNDAIKYGKDMIFITIYVLVKMNYSVAIWKNHYTRISVKFVHAIPEAVLFFIKLILIWNMMLHPEQYEQKVLFLTTAIQKISEDNISAIYVSMTLFFGGLLLFLWIIKCLASQILNHFRIKRYQLFFDNEASLPMIGFIHRMETTRFQNPDYFQSNDMPCVATLTEKTICHQPDVIKDISHYSQEPETLAHLAKLICSNNNTLELQIPESYLYYDYIKDKLSQWKEANSANESFMDQELIKDLTDNFHSISSIYSACGAESKTYFDLYHQYMNEFDVPYHELNELKKQITHNINQLYSDYDMLYWDSKGKELVNDTLQLFGKQALNLIDLRVEVDGYSLHTDNILISNRGIFVLNVKNLGTSGGGYDLIIEKDGSWWKKMYTEDFSTNLIPMDVSPSTTNNQHVLSLEKLINESLKLPLDQYLEVIGIVVIIGEELRVENHSSQSIIRCNEVIPKIREHGIIFNEERMHQLSKLLLSFNLAPQPLTITNYRTRIIEPLDELLQKKSNLINQNALLMQKVNLVYQDFLDHSRKYGVTML